jgi:flagellar protein FlaI
MKILAKYAIVSEGVPAEVVISQKDEEYINSYEITHVHVREPTRVVLDYLKEKIIESVDIKISEILDPREAERVRERVIAKAHEFLEKELTGLGRDEEKVLVGKLIQEMMGLGEIELLLADENLEEIVVNSSAEPVCVYHKKFGWLKTNIFIQSEEQIHNYAAIIGRKIGKQITNLNPLMDAHLLSGDRANATLFPISTKGNTITIRKFAREPWTIINYIDPAYRTMDVTSAALFWLALEYEINVLVGGGTASGKTSFLNTILVFTPPNQRIVSVEDTRELLLPNFLNWTPLTTRSPNPEGKGEITMLDLMVNSLRMRPDRIVLGEIRRQREAEVLFEAMHTGHAVYSTLHADEAWQVRNRLISPPISLPEQMLSSLQLIAVMYRQRRTGIRRLFEIAEVMPQEDKVSVNVVARWNPREDKLEKVGEYVRLINDLTLHTGMTMREIEDDLKEKEQILEYMHKHKVDKVNPVGKIVAWYYRDAEKVKKIVEKGLPPQDLLK